MNKNNSFLKKTFCIVFSLVLAFFVICSVTKKVNAAFALSVDVSELVENGTFKFNVTINMPTRQFDVTITPKANDGYELAFLYVYNKKDKTQQIKVKDYKFSVPFTNDDIEVYGYFEKIYGYTTLLSSIRTIDTPLASSSKEVFIAYAEDYGWGEGKYYVHKKNDEGNYDVYKKYKEGEEYKYQYLNLELSEIIDLIYTDKKTFFQFNTIKKGTVRKIADASYLNEDYILYDYNMSCQRALSYAYQLGKVKNGTSLIYGSDSSTISVLIYFNDIWIDPAVGTLDSLRQNISTLDSQDIYAICANYTYDETKAEVVQVPASEVDKVPFFDEEIDGDSVLEYANTCIANPKKNDVLVYKKTDEGYGFAIYSGASEWSLSRNTDFSEKTSTPYILAQKEVPSVYLKELSTEDADIEINSDLETAKAFAKHIKNPEYNTTIIYNTHSDFYDFYFYNYSDLWVKAENVNYDETFNYNGGGYPVYGIITNDQNPISKLIEVDVSELETIEYYEFYNYYSNANEAVFTDIIEKENIGLCSKVSDIYFLCYYTLPDQGGSFENNYVMSLPFNPDDYKDLSKLYALVPENYYVDITITEDAQSYTYDGDGQEFEIAGTELTGFKVEYYVSDAWTETKPINVGKYDVKVTRPEDIKYSAFECVIEDGLEITPKEIMINWDSQEFVYNADDQEVLAYYYDINVDSVDLVCTYLKEDGETTAFNTAGTYTVTAAFASTDNTLGNYKLPDEYTKEYTILKRKVSIELADEETPVTKVFDNTTDTVAGDGWQLVNEGYGTLEVTVKYDSENVDEATKVYIYELSDTDNFEIDEDACEVEATITPLEIIIDWDDSEFVYNYEEQEVVATYEDINEDDINLVCTYLKEDLETTVFKTAGKYTVTVSFATTDNLNGNYKLPDEYTKEYTILKKKVGIELTVEGTPVTKVFDNTTDTVAAEGWQLADDYGVLEVTVKYDSENVDEVTKVYIYELSDTDNFEIDEDACEVEAEITPLEIVIDWETTAMYTYNRKEQAVKPAYYDDIEENPIKLAFSYLKEDLETTVFMTAGYYTVTADFAETDNLHGNYKLPEVHSRVYRMFKASPKISTTNFQYQFVYTGKEQVVDSGAELNHDETVLVYTNNKFTDVEDGFYEIFISAEETANWLAAEIRCVIWVAKAESTIDEGEVTTKFVYDGNAHSIEEIATLSNTEGTISYKDNSFCQAGEYEVIITSNETANYKAAKKVVKVVVEKAKTIIDTTNIVKEYVFNGLRQTIDSGATINHTETEVIYENNAFQYVKTGKLTLVVKALETANYQAAKEEVEITIKKAQGTLDVTNIPTKFVYNGEVQKVDELAIANHAEAQIYYRNNFVKDAGKYTVDIALPETADYLGVKVSVEVEVLKATLDMSQVAWTYYGALTYNTKEQTISLVGLPIGVEAKLSGNKATNAGSYTAKASLTYDTDNYNEVKVEDCKWEIAKADLDVTSMVWNYNGAYTYDGNEKEVTLKNVPSAIKVAYKDNSATNAGTYTAKAELTYDTANYNEVKVEDCKFIINKAWNEIDTKDVVLTYTYNGKEIEVTGAKSKSSDSVITYENGKFTNAGRYEVTIKASETANYQASEKKVYVVVNKATIDMSNVKFENKEYTYDNEGHSLKVENLPVGVKVEYSKENIKEAGAYTITATFDAGENYNPIQPLTAILVIKSVNINSQTTDKNNNQYAKFEFAGGIPQGIKAKAIVDVLYSKNVGKDRDLYNNYASFLGRFEELNAVYDIKLYNGEEEVQPSDIQPGAKITVKILIPDTLKDSKFRMLHVHGNDVKEINKAEQAGVGTFTIEDNYAVTEIEDCSEFAFVSEKACHIHVYQIVLIVLFVLVMVGVIINKAKLVGLIASVIYAVAFAVTLFFMHCSICTILTVVGALVLVASIVILVLIGKKNN